MLKFPAARTRVLWILLAAATIIAGCHGGGGSGLPPAPAGGPNVPKEPRHSNAQAAYPVPTISPETICELTTAGDSQNTQKYACFLQGGVASSPLPVGGTVPLRSSYSCNAGTYVFEEESGGADPPSPLPSPNVTFNPAQSTPGPCSKTDSTTLTFTFPSPLPLGGYAVKFKVEEDYTYTAFGGTYTGQTTIAEFFLHGGLRIKDVDASQEIQNSTWERSVGQGVNLQALAPTDQETLGPCSWQVPNAVSPYAVGSYASYSGSTPPAVVPSPSPVPSLTNVSQFQLYWVQPFDATQMNVTCTVSNANFTSTEGGVLNPIQLSALVNPYVVAPTQSISATFGSINLGEYGDGLRISLGTQMNPPSSFGLQSTYNVTMPTDYGGYFGANQLVNFTSSENPVPSPTPPNTGNAFQLDGCPIYTTYWNGTTIPSPAPRTLCLTRNLSGLLNRRRARVRPA